MLVPVCPGVHRSDRAGVSSFRFAGLLMLVRRVP